MDGVDEELRLQSVWNVLIGWELYDIWLVDSNWSKGRLFSHWLLIGSHVSSLHSDHVHGRGSFCFTAKASLSILQSNQSAPSLLSLAACLHKGSSWFPFDASRPDFFLLALSMHKVSRTCSDHALSLHILSRTLHHLKTSQMAKLCILGLSRSVPSVLPRPKYAHLPICSQTLF